MDGKVLLDIYDRAAAGISLRACIDPSLHRTRAATAGSSVTNGNGNAELLDHVGKDI